MKENREEGAIVVEASIALPVYVFTIFTILSIINICYAQSKMQVALNTAAKQLSEISYVMYASGLIDEGGATGGTTSNAAQRVSGELDKIMNSFGVQNDSLSEVSQMIGQTSLTTVINNEVAKAAMKSLVNREFKLSKNGSPTGLRTWLNFEGEPKVHAIVTDNDVLVAGAYYEVKVIELLNIDITYEFHSGTISYLWTGTKRDGTGIKKGN